MGSALADWHSLVWSSKDYMYKKKKKNEVVERTNLGESRVGGCQDLHFTFPQEFDRATLLIEDRR